MHERKAIDAMHSASGFRKLLTTEFFLAVFLVAMLLFLRIITPGFFSINNIMSTLNYFSYILIGAIGMNMIILTSNIDVSSGAIVSVVCFVIATVGKTGANIVVLMIIAIIVGAFLSFINGIFITRLRIPAIVATLATALLFAGSLNLFTEGSIYDLPSSFTWLAFEAKLFGKIPASLILMFVIAVSAVIYMKYSRFSKKIYAVGNNIKGSRLVGINADKVVIVVYTIAGALFGVVGTIIGTAGQRVTTTMGTGLEMTFIAAVVLGGTSISGGSGKIIGTVIGALILSIISPAINYLGISSDWTEAIMGVIIIVSVVVSAARYLSKRKKRILAPAMTGGRGK